MKRLHEVPRRDWILLALNAATARNLTALKLQKSLFLLGARRAQDVGEYYTFRPYHYGPFSADIYRDADDLCDEGLMVVDMSLGRSMRRYVLTDAGERRASLAARNAAPSALAYLRDVVAWAEPLSFNVLVRAVYEAFPEMRENSIFSDSETS